MSNIDIGNLIRMAVEIDEVEQLAAAGAPDTPVGGAADGSGRVADGGPVILHYDQLQSKRLRWRMGLSAAAAAAGLLLLLHPWSSELAPQDAAAAPIEIDYCPGIALDNGVRIDRFEPTSAEHGVVLAIFHAWHEECQCLGWQLHEWEDGGALAKVAPGQALDIALDVSAAPPVEQLLLLAISQDPAQLPRTAEQTYDLIDCLNELTPPTDPCDSVAAYTSAVKACLSKGVRVIPQPFFVE